MRAEAAVENKAMNQKKKILNFPNFLKWKPWESLGMCDSKGRLTIYSVYNPSHVYFLQVLNGQIFQIYISWLSAKLWCDKPITLGDFVDN